MENLGPQPSPFGQTAHEGGSVRAQHSCEGVVDTWRTSNGAWRRDRTRRFGCPPPPYINARRCQSSPLTLALKNPSVPCCQPPRNPLSALSNLHLPFRNPSRFRKMAPRRKANPGTEHTRVSPNLISNSYLGRSSITPKNLKT